MKNISENIDANLLLGLVSELLDKEYLKDFEENERLVLLSGTIIKLLSSYLKISSNQENISKDNYIIDVLLKQIKEYLENKSYFTEGKRERFLTEVMELLCHLSYLYSKNQLYLLNHISMNYGEKNKLLLKLFTYGQKKLGKKENGNDFEKIMYYCSVSYGFLYSSDYHRSDYICLVEHLKKNVNSVCVEKAVLKLGQKALEFIEKQKKT
jgi:hypothetical protein